ncbi:hypothetical protein [Solirubrobacter soli]|uniref:hypothetical protein n=1 Tax=Solirubrobacter soli TaxID=363832 RepID=UPI00040E0378|nr:hypothetical protein [Solirubrobacter soli]
MPSGRNEFSEAALSELVRALYKRAEEHPTSPGLIASWPAIREERMAAACAELIRLGHPLFQIEVADESSRRSRIAWAIRAETDQPIVMG